MTAICSASFSAPQNKMTQLEIDYTREPMVIQSEIDMVCELIASAQSNGCVWTPALYVMQELGYSERKVRAIAEHSQGRIVSGPGTPGYHLLDSPADFDSALDAERRLIAQIRKMAKRVNSIRRRRRELTMKPLCATS